MGETQPAPPPPDVIQAKPDVAAQALNIANERQMMDQKEQQLNGLSPRVRVEAFNIVGRNAIKEYKAKGGFNKDGALKASSDKALERGDISMEELTSDEIKAQIKSLEAIKNQGDDSDKSGAERILKELAPYVKIKMGEGDNAKEYTLEQWEQLPAEEKANLEGQVKYKVELPPEETKEAEPARPTSQEQLTPEDAVIAVQITNLERDIKAAQSRGEDTKRQEQFLVTLRLAQQANGEIGILLKARAINLLGVRELDVVVKGLELQTVVAEQKLIEHLKSHGWTEDQINKIKTLTGDVSLDWLIKEGGLLKVEGLSTLVFGKELGEQEIENLLDAHLAPDQAARWKKIKKGGLFFLLALLLLGMEGTKVMGGSTSGR